MPPGFVGRTPRSEADALVGFLGVTDLWKSRTGGAGENQGIRPTTKPRYYLLEADRLKGGGIGPGDRY